ncbi:MAG: hypothetical protein ACO3RO_06775 [Flavobacteriaceae bacterium]
MKNTLFFVVLWISLSAFSQAQLVRLKGQVLYRNSFVSDEAVVNSTREISTITDENGAFSIDVAVGDELVFTAVNFQLEVIKITEDILKNGRLVVEVTEKVRQLDEVVLTPDNQEAFIELKNEEFKGFEYAIDRASAVDNIALSPAVRGMQDGLNVVSVFKLLKSLLASKDQKDGPSIKLSEALAKVYDERFFIEDLRLQRAQIPDFLAYCDERVPTFQLLRKENEFELLEFLVTTAEAFKEEMK